VETDAENRGALTFRAPRRDGTMGTRILDMRVLDADGNVEGYVETKWGGAGARYSGSDQEFQDNWPRSNLGLNISVASGG
jgi:hypothetical protein